MLLCSGVRRQDSTQGRARALAPDSIHATWTLIGFSQRWCADGKACHIGADDGSAVRESGVGAEVDDVGQVGHLASWRACVCACVPALAFCTMVHNAWPIHASGCEEQGICYASCMLSDITHACSQGHELLAHMLPTWLHSLYSSMQTRNPQKG